MNRIFYIMGKSSSGKDTVYKHLISEMNLIPIIMYTTRPMRENERHGREYYFVDRTCFDKMCSSGDVIENRIYNTVYGEWIYFTARDSISIEKGNCIGIGTLESFIKIRDFFGSAVIPIYIETDDGIRLSRALERERTEKFPKYKELCRRFIADCDDFSEEKLLSTGINRRFQNDSDIESCIDEIKKYINNTAIDNVSRETTNS